jgi:iron complex outermembrane recepter protein
MRKTPLFLLALFSYALLRAQGISGVVKDSRGKLLANASVALKKTKDSSLFKLSLSDTGGHYSFLAIPAGTYFIAVSHIAYLSGNSAAFSVADGAATQVPSIELSTAPRELRQAQVTGMRPLVEVRSDRIILNIENTINAIGQDALDLLRKSPGVAVDNTDAISLNGKNGVQIFIDGRQTYLSGTALTQYLHSLQSSSIESIEIINNPPARYEAAGTGGIINIRLKRDRALGTNITGSLGYQLGTYSKYDGDIGFNHRNQHFNLFGDYTFRDATTLSKSVYYRTLPDSLFKQQDFFVIKTVNHNIHAGLDYYIDKKSTIGLLVDVTLVTDSVKTNSRTPIIYTPANRTDRLLIANNRTSELQDNYNFNLNYHYAGGKGQSLELNADYGLYRLRSNQLQPNNYFDSTDQTFLYGNENNILSPTNIDISSFKVDYTLNLFKGQLGLGGKVSYVTSANDFQEYNLGAPGRVLDSLNSDNFSYKENINAAYLNYNRTYKSGLTLQAGLRAENTNNKGISKGWQGIANDYSVYDSTYPRHYTGFFPSASLNWKQWSVSYSRRIDRPNYQDLNPFVFKIDDYTFGRGNTQLQPQYANSISLTWSYKYALSATLSYSHIGDLFTSVPDTTDISKTVVTQVNLASKDIAGLNLSYSFQYRWYSAFINLNAYYASYKGNLGVGKVIDLTIFHTTILSQHTVQLGKGWSANITQLFSSPSITAGTLRFNSLGSLDAGLQKTFLSGRATIKAVVSDIFFTLPWSATSNFAGQYIYTAGSNETRQLKVNFVYRFGNTQVKPALRHLTGADDENKRINPAKGALQ